MKKMLKALTGLLVVCLLSIGIAATVFGANESPGPAVNVDFDKEVTFVGGAGIDDAAIQTFRQLAGLSAEDQMNIVWGADITTEDHSVTMTITPNVPGKIYVFHKSATKGWELAGSGTGQFVVILTDLSPVAMVAVPEEETDPEEETTPAEEETTPAEEETTPAKEETKPAEEATSPKTGESAMLPTAAASAILLGGVLLAKALKKKAE